MPELCKSSWVDMSVCGGREDWSRLFCACSKVSWEFQSVCICICMFFFSVHFFFFLMVGLMIFMDVLISWTLWSAARGIFKYLHFLSTNRGHEQHSSGFLQVKSLWIFCLLLLQLPVSWTQIEKNRKKNLSCLEKLRFGRTGPATWSFYTNFWPFMLRWI